MERSELKEIIKKEIRKVLNEANFDVHTYIKLLNALDELSNDIKVFKDRKLTKLFEGVIGRLVELRNGKA